MTTSIDVARMESELESYYIRSQNDEKLIGVLKEQNARQAREIELMSMECAEKIRRLSQERDEAVRKATEVSGLLEQAAESIVSGLRKMKGDDTPAVVPDVPNLARIGKMRAAPEPDEELTAIVARLPKNELMA